jgi:predicted dienelactone hydrolase
MIRPRAIGAAVVLFLSAPALAQSPPPSDSTVTLPTPTGSHPVGARRFHWVDAQRPELSPHVASRPRELLVRVWYPAATRNGVPEPYLPQLETYRDSGCIGPRTAGVAPRVRHAALRDAPPARGTARHPVVVFSTGNGEMEYMYTALMEELASHGFITVLVPHPGIADVVYPDGRVLHRYRRMFDPKPDGWEASLPATLPATLKRAMYDTMYTESAGYLAADIRFVLDQLERMDRTPGDPLGGRIDLSRVATSGHSHGGLIAVEAAATDPRVKACFQLDGAAFGPVRERGLTKPHLLIRPAFDNDGTPRGWPRTRSSDPCARTATR